MPAAAEPVVALAPNADAIALLGTSAAARRLLDELRATAGARYALLQGEPGLELEQVASALHHHSGRGGACVQLAPAAGEDADAIAVALSRARGGTVVIQDLQHFSRAGQRRLLQAARTAQGAGAPAVVAAMSGADGEQDPPVRGELLQCFAHARITVPPLRSRAEDIAAMARALIEGVCGRAAVPAKTLSAAAAAALEQMPWRGNILELRAAVDRLVRSAPADEIGLGDLLAQVRFEPCAAVDGTARTLRAARRQFERDYIRHVLRCQGGRVGDAARLLGMQRTNLYRKARQLGITLTRPEQA